jgi:hypothetical protein
MLDCEIMSSGTNGPWLRKWTRWSGIEWSVEAAHSQKSYLSSVLVFVYQGSRQGGLGLLMKLVNQE